jgi:hypothetical protein
MLDKLILTAALAAIAALAGCGSGDNEDSTPAVPQSKALLSVPGITNAVTFSFDLAQIDATTGKYYVTDRNNKGIDVVDLTTNLVTQFIPPAGTAVGQMAGCRTGTLVAVPTCTDSLGVTVNNNNSGPNGLDLVPAMAATPASIAAGTTGTTIYVGDVNALWVLDRATGTVIRKINIGGVSNFSADKGCFDPVDNIYGISSPGETPPFMTFVDAINFNVLATVYFNSIPGFGMEACVFDATTGKFFVNNNASAVNPHGEVDGINAAVFAPIRAAAGPTGPGVKWLMPGAPAAGQPAIAGGAAVIPAAAAVTVFPLGNNCDPTGITLGPTPELAVMCRQGNVGDLLTFQILNKTTGANIIALNAGGGDQIAFDGTSYILADSRWTATGTSCGAGSAGCPLTPVLAVVNATTRAITMTPSGNNAHSVAVGSGKIVQAFAVSTQAGGGANFGLTLRPVPAAATNGGIAIFQ